MTTTLTLGVEFLKAGGFGESGRLKVKPASNRVQKIESNLSTVTGLSTTKPLNANADTCFLGIMKAGAFDITEAEAIQILQSPSVGGKPNSDVLRPRLKIGRAHV